MRTWGAKGEKVEFPMNRNLKLMKLLPLTAERRDYKTENTSKLFLLIIV